MLHAILALAILVPAAPPRIPYGTGYLPSSPRQRQEFKSKGLNFDRLVGSVKAAPPPQYELKWMPRPHPAGQGMRGTCVSWAMAYAAKSCLESHEAEAYADGPDRFFSPTFIYSQRLKRDEEGMRLPEAAYLLYAHGCLPWSEMPYLEATADTPPTAEQERAARIYQIADWAVLTPCTSEKIRLAISMDLPVVIGARVTDEFMDLNGDAVFRDFDPARIKAGHAMCVVGYDDSRQAVRVINSWGRGWGDQGYGWISYDLFDKTSDDSKKFCAEAVALLDAPNLTPNVRIEQAGEGTGWVVSISGSPKALAQVQCAEYLLPAGYEPSAIRRENRGDDAPNGETFILRSSDVRAVHRSAIVEIWVQFHLKTTRRLTYPRPIMIGASATPGRVEPNRRPDVPPPGPDRRPSRPDTETREKIAVPNVVGQDSTMATIRLTGAGFKVNLRRQSGADSSARPGTVTSQDPAAGSSASKGTTVILTIP
jgi:hypothetical protein